MRKYFFVILILFIFSCGAYAKWVDGNYNGIVDPGEESGAVSWALTGTCLFLPENSVPYAGNSTLWGVEFSGLLGNILVPKYLVLDWGMGYSGIGNSQDLYIDSVKAGRISFGSAYTSLGVGWKFWVGEKFCVIPKVCGYLGFANYQATIDLGAYKATKPQATFEKIGYPPYYEAEASLGLRWYYWRTLSVSVEYGLRPQLAAKPDNWTKIPFSQSIKAGFYFEIY